MNNRNQRLLDLLREHDAAVVLRRTYLGKIHKAVASFDDSFERELAQILTSSQTVGVLRDLNCRVRRACDEFKSTEERDVAIRVIAQLPDDALDVWITVVRAVCIQPDDSGP